MTQHLNNSQLRVHRTELANALAVSKARLGTFLDQHRLAIYERLARSAQESIKACIALIRHAGRNVVLMKSGDVLLPCQVEPGEVSDGKVLIESGLHEGDQIVSVVTDQQRRMLNEKLGASAEFGE